MYLRPHDKAQAAILGFMVHRHPEAATLTEYGCPSLDYILPVFGRAATAPRVRLLAHWTTLTVRSVFLIPCETVPFIPGGAANSPIYQIHIRVRKIGADRTDLDKDPIQQFVRPAVKTANAAPIQMPFHITDSAPDHVLTEWLSFSSIRKARMMRQ